MTACLGLEAACGALEHHLVETVSNQKLLFCFLLNTLHLKFTPAPASLHLPQLYISDIFLLLLFVTFVRASFKPREHQATRWAHLSLTGAQPEDPVAVKFIQSDCLVEAALVNTNSSPITWGGKETGSQVQTRSLRQTRLWTPALQMQFTKIIF